MIIPKSLKIGDTIGVIAPSSPIVGDNIEELDQAKEIIEKEKSEYKNGILLENSDGKLLITKDTLENLVNTIVKSFDGAENAVARIELDNENNLKVFVNISVKENAVIKELSSNIQARIKEAIKTTSDLDVKEVNIKVKDVAPVKKTVVQE